MSITTTARVDLEPYAKEYGRRAKEAARAVALASTDQKNGWLRRFAAQLRAHTDLLLRANQRDVQAAHGFGLTPAQIDRLRLNYERIEAMAKAVEQIATLPDPVGEVIESTTRPNGLKIDKVRVPLGVIFFIYEARPNVTSDAAALCVKSGNAIILRGGKEAYHTGMALHTLISDTLTENALPADAVQMVRILDHEVVGHLLQASEFIDLTIPRGGVELVRLVTEQARMPVMKHFQGICHIYVHSAADAEMARSIVLNAKCQRPGMCNAAESLLVDRAVAADLLPSLLKALQESGVEIRGCESTRMLASSAELAGVQAAAEQDYATEYLDLKISVRVVDGLDAAIDHIARYGSGHTDTIITRDDSAAREFTRRVDSSAVMVNASTRFNDGGEFGLGAEIGISTDKFHARGPCGLRELTSYKYIVRGEGHVRN